MTEFKRWQKNLGPCRGGSGIQEFYSVTLTGLEILLKEVVSKKGYDQSGAAKTWWKNLQHYVVLLLEDKQIWEGRTVMFPQIDH